MLLSLLLLGVCLLLGAVTVTYTSQIKVVETLPNNTGSASDANRKITHDQYDESGTYTGATTPPVTQCAFFLGTLSGGALTVDLRALTTTNGATLDLNGLKVQMVRIKNLGANDMTFKEGASNGHNLFSATDGFTVPPGGHVQIFTNDNTDDVSGSNKTWDVTGTGSQTFECSIVAG